MECIRGESKLNIKTLNRTLKFSLKGPVRTHHYLNTYIRLDMNEINEQLKAINVHLSIIDSKTQLINDKLDEIITALHEYDNDQIQHCEYSGLPSVKAYDEKDIMSWNVDGAERRMDIIGQNGNTGEHYDDDRELGGEG